MATTQARAVRLERTGGPETLTFADVALPAPGKGEALVRHTALGLNFIDVYHRTGLYKLPLPTGIGMEAAGVVEAVGPDAGEVKVGDRVAYACLPPGAYATARTMPADRLVPLPSWIDDETAASAMLKGMTAQTLLRQTYKVEPEQTVLVHAAAGGVGTILSQWAKSLGARVIGTVGHADKVALATESGCDHVLTTDDPDWAQKVLELTEGLGVPVVYDGIGQATFTDSLKVLARRGMFISYGNASGPVAPFAPTLLSSSGGGSLYLTRPSFMHYTATRVELMASAAELFEALHTGAVKIHIGQRWPLEQAADAHRALEARRTTGATVLTI